MKNIKPTLVLSCICMAVALILSAINMVTAPIIEANRNASANEALLVVLPEGENFEEIDLSAAELPAIVTKAYKETNGKGFVFQMTSTGYQPGLVIMCGVDAEGKITGVTHLETKETYGKEAELNGVYIGQSLADFSAHIISGATKSSTGYSDAISAALQAHVLLSGGELDPSFALIDMISSLAPGLGTTEAIDATGNIFKAFKSKSDTGFAYIFKSNDTAYLAVVNAFHTCKVFDVEGNDVTAGQEAIVVEATAHAFSNQTSYTEAIMNKVIRLYETATDITPLIAPTFNTVVSAVSFKVDGAEYYGFYSRSIGFHQMDVYIIIDANGAIAKIDAKQFIFDEEYFSGFGGMDAGAYKAGFEGLTSETWTGDAAVIATATMTSNAMKQSTEDAFATFDSVKGGIVK